MTTSTQKEQSVNYSDATRKRAERALSCSPFLLPLFAAMRNESIPLPMMTGQSGVDKGYTKTPLAELWTERHLLWLIKVGLLRREVDGQGITDSFRLTPLGRQLVAKWENLGGNFPKPSFWDSIINSINRWLSLSF
ncbi:Npun_F0494 family protein [Aphanothece hegewaldii]|uniref:Npun_F0494 family protein n=1 Tax=Aphanothece hegewaldii TaxID=1521625 RepID=UPI003CCB7D4C